MKRWLPILALLLLACQAVGPLAEAVVGPRRAAPTSLPALAPPSATPRPRPAAAPPDSGAAASTAAADFIVRLHPEDGLYTGDQVSFEVIAPPGLAVDERSLHVSLAGMELGQAGFTPFGIGGRFQATLLWAWDTSGLAPGSYRLDFRLEPDGPAWSQAVELLDVQSLPAVERLAAWQSAQTACCIVHYVSGTPAERDLPAILVTVQAQAESASRRMGAALPEEISVVLLPRVLGHGGFANYEIAVSYLERNYANNNLEQVVHHEMVHILDRQLGGEYLPSLFVEGLAVYLSRGHYKREPLLSRAAALVQQGGYLSLARLADDFYQSQHEIGYLQAGALVQYMVNTWGWDAFNDFYRSIEPPEDGRPSSAIDRALQAQWGLSLAELEARFVNELARQALNPDMADDLRLSAAYYDIVRRYQQALDPSAYFLTAWLLDGREMRSREIVADYLRHPDEPLNLALEAMLAAAGEHLRLGQYPQAGRLLHAVQRALSALEAGAARPLAADPLAQEYQSLVDWLLGRGFEVQQARLEGQKARVWVSTSGPTLMEIDLVQAGDGWTFAADS
jgi:hypothetical protein